MFLHSVASPPQASELLASLKADASLDAATYASGREQARAMAADVLLRDFTAAVERLGRGPVPPVTWKVRAAVAQGEVKRIQLTRHLKVFARIFCAVGECFECSGVFSCIW